MLKRVTLTAGLAAILVLGEAFVALGQSPVPPPDDIEPIVPFTGKIVCGPTDYGIPCRTDGCSVKVRGVIVAEPSVLDIVPPDVEAPSSPRPERPVDPGPDPKPPLPVARPDNLRAGPATPRERDSGA